MRKPMLPLLLLAALGLPAQTPVEGLAPGSVFQVPSPPAFKDEASAPGEKGVLKRINREFPPMIPHAVADFLPITREANMCLDCHGTQAPRKAGEPTPVPASHYVDLRRAPEQKGAKVAGTRWVCLSCHVPQTDAKPLVRNTFRP